MTAKGQVGELLVVFVKYPEPGRVKTRLAAGIGANEAAAAYRELVTTTFEAIGQWLQEGELARDHRPPRTVWVYFDPAEKRTAIQTWLDPEVRCWTVPPQWVAQPEGELGGRLQSAFHQGFNAGFYAICAIGTDCPELTGDGLERAFSELSRWEGVAGPTRDGGYYLIGVKTEHSLLFENIPWSSPETFSATCKVAERLGLHLAILPMLEDVDTEADWRRWRRLNSGI
jgi:rSAM/selenodomain-associated transferase 1